MTNVNNLDHYLHRWNLHHPEHIAQTPTSHVYRANQNGDKVVLKLFTPVGVEDEFEGVYALQYFAGEGAVRVLDHDDRALLMEYAGDEELAQMVTSDQGDEAAAQIIAELLNKLHRDQPGKPIPQLRTLRRRFRSLFERAAREEALGDESIYGRGARVAEQLLAAPQNECILHGDIQHHNIRRHPVRGWLAYDAKGLYGERLYDAANTLCNPMQRPDLAMSEERLLRVTQLLADGMGVAVGRLRAFVFAYSCLSASWDDKPEGSDVQNLMLTVARHAERHVDF